ncbi:MAG TPA: hypothetical protein VMW69_10545, partial [Spirochaetia bacterium]|nr:hypothetical protein [Spirochaetia bacterium]
MQNLLDLLRRQLRINRSKNLLNVEIEGMLEIDPLFLAAMEECAASTAPADRRFEMKMAASAARLFTERIYGINQYVQIGRNDRRRLQQIYLESWQELRRSGDVEATLRDLHFPRIKGFVESLYPSELRSALRKPLSIGRVTCS